MKNKKSSILRGTIYQSNVKMDNKIMQLNKIETKKG